MVIMSRPEKINLLNAFVKTLVQEKGKKKMKLLGV
jgi:hypothetical protein